MDGLKTKINVKDIGIVEALLAFYTLFMYDLGHVFYLNIIWIFYFFYSREQVRQHFFLIDGSRRGSN